ncbi:16S rRNA m(5)C-967 methyltransferase [Tahibacter aquaticus]|uniref:16S rRNA (cytosine(967)-C(5))-methyltransferase n=1 Tax=Tahibacter aquaticus TaxID=520092 RepID=A0A4R6YV26_9GAMM|nr:16S rRNA (cytosine(967)-C(5))-methyltransferase RsmB [Tahibacter aquaticus]TDR42521.1 16S rRNA m(5)C-967 methyltransferase [Tahibacter aquaticus]
MNDTRALAAQALDQIVRGGVSLRVAFAAVAPRLADPRDRALVSALLHEGSRWWLRYDHLIGHLLQKPLNRREPVVHALLVLGLVQLAVLGMPEYAAVAGTVEATRALKRPQLAGLVNAVLRRFLRERAGLEAALQADRALASAHPAWLAAELERDWPQDIDALLAANNTSAALTLRVNRRRAARDELIGRLLQAGYEAQAHAWLSDAIVLGASTDVTALPGYAQGHFSVQDGAAQLTPELLALQDGMRLLDACAAPGGKTAHCLEHYALDLTALDRDSARLANVRDNLTRLGVRAHIATGDAARPADWWDRRQFDRILLDAPCSATGVIRRQPDIRLHRRSGDIARLATEQTQLLDALWPLLRPGGRLLYATCSVLRRENEQQIGAFLARQADARALDAIPPRFGRAAGAGRQNLPGNDGMDGFFYAIVEKAA